MSRTEADAGGIGLIGAAAIGIGGMVGGGIFAVLGVAAEQAGGATPIAFAVGGAIAAMTAYAYSRLSVEFQSSGGTVAFIDGVFGVGAVTGTLNIILWIGYLATTALYTAAFANYGAALLFGGGSVNGLALRGLMVVGIAIPWFINLANAGIVARSESFVVAVKVLILMIVVAAGAPNVSAARLDPALWPSPVAIIAAGMLIFVAYEGFELIANASADVKRPGRTLPFAFAAAISIVIALYLAISVVVVGTLSPDEIVASADFALAEAASASLGQFGFVLVGISAVLATFSAINATLYGSARLSYTIATEGELPDRLQTKTWNQPIGLHITALVGLAIAVTLTLSSISALASAIFLVVFAVVNVAAFKRADRPLARIITAAGAVGCAGSLFVLLARTAADDPVASVALALLISLGLGAEHLFLKHRRPGQFRITGR